jgi:hypothetical protein
VAAETRSGIRSLVEPLTRALLLVVLAQGFGQLVRVPAKAGEIRSLFSGLEIHLHRITLAPPIARRIPESLLPLLYPLLATLPILRTHYLGLFIKRDKPDHSNS